jgi:hypothetical protein
MSIIFYFGPNFLNVGSLTLCLSVRNSPGAMLHKVLNYQRKFHPSTANPPPPHSPAPTPGLFLTLR